MLPSSRKELRKIEDSLYAFIKRSDLLQCEKYFLNSAFDKILLADSFVAHMGCSHTELFKKEHSDDTEI